MRVLEALRIGSNPVGGAICPITPTEEGAGLEPVKCGFKSHVGYQIGLEVGISSSTINFLLNLAGEFLPK